MDTDRPTRPSLPRRAHRRLPAAAALAVTVALVLASCGSSSTDEATSADPAPTTTTAAPASGEATTPPTTAVPVVDRAPWQTIEITDVAGETFSLAEFVGTPVFVENFATWCSSCRSQLATTQSAAATLGDEAVFVVLSVETSLSSSAVADYAEDNGFTDMRFAVMTPELLAAFVDAFGNSAVNPPSTPHLVMGPSGAAGEMRTGSISESDIVDELRSAA